MAKNIASTVEDTMRSGLHVSAESFERVTDQFSRAVQPGSEITQQTTQNLEAIAQTSTVLARGVQDLTREWLQVTQSGLQMNADGLTQLVRCRSVQDFVAVQSDLVRDNLHQMIEATRRIAERSLEMAKEAMQTITSQQEAQKPIPAIPIKKSITPDYLISLEDGKPYRSLKRHLRGHGLTPEQYREKYGLPPDYPMVAPTYAARRSELAKSMGLGQSRQTGTTAKVGRSTSARAGVKAPAKRGHKKVA